MGISNTKSETLFNLQKSIDLWIDGIRDDPSIEENERNGLHNQLLEQINDLKDMGFDDEEAFFIAARRLNANNDLSNEYQNENNQSILKQKSLIILGGVLVYFLIFYFILASSKVLFMAIYSLNDANAFLAMNWFQRSLIFWQFIIVAFMVSIFLFEKRIIIFIDEIRLKPKHTIIILFFTIFFELTNLITQSLIKGYIREITDLRDRFLQDNLYFEIGFPLLICASFVFIYYKYYKKTKV